MIRCMIIDYRPRQSGKTTDMIAWLSQNKGRILITFNIKERDRLRKMVENKQFAFLEGYKGLLTELSNRIMTKDDYERHFYQGKVEIGVDNADIILEEIFKSRIEKITLSE